MKGSLRKRIAVFSVVAMGGYILLPLPVIADDAGHAFSGLQVVVASNATEVKAETNAVISPDKLNHKSVGLFAYNDGYNGPNANANMLGVGQGHQAAQVSVEQLRTLLDSIVARRLVFHSSQALGVEQVSEFKLTVELTGGRDALATASMAELIKQVQVQAVLSSATLSVQNSTPVSQPLSLGDLHRWRWQVSGSDAGRHRMHLIVSVAAQGQQQTLKSLDRKLTIRPPQLTSKQLFLKILNQYALWISAGLLLFIFVVALLKNRGPLRDDPTQKYLGPERRRHERRKEEGDRRTSTDQEAIINSRRTGKSDRRMTGFDRRSSSR